MSNRYNTLFFKNPKSFARKHVMTCTAIPEYELKVHDHYLSVPSDNRICYWDIEEEQMDPQEGICNVMISPVYKENYRVGFYLPYRSNSIIKCTLKDKRSSKMKLIYGEAEAFFTYIIDGCSIIIEGTSQEPVIYHANKSNSLPTEREKTAKTLTRRWRRTDLSKWAYNILQTEQSPRVQFHGQALHAIEYLANEKKLVQKYERSFYITKVYGFVFGVRKKGNWEFYLQKNLKRIGVGGKIYCVLSVQKFWPGNGLGVQVLRPPHETYRGFEIHMERETERAIGNQMVFNSITDDML